MPQNTGPQSKLLFLNAFRLGEVKFLKIKWLVILDVYYKSFRWQLLQFGNKDLAL